MFSIRVRGSTVRALQEQAARYRTAPRTLAEEMVEEGVRTRAHPGIVFMERAGGRRDAVLAARPRLGVWQIVRAVRASTSIKAAAEYLSLDMPSLERALAYYNDNPDEIERLLVQNAAEVERIERLYPSTADVARIRSVRGRRRASPRAR